MPKQNVTKKSDFEEIYIIMQNSFPIDEYRTKEEQKRLFEEKEYRVTIERDNLKKAVAFIAFWDLGSFIFIEHFAVATEKRNSGIGSKLLKKFLDESDKKIVLEVEKPISELARRRIKFYERNGFVFNDFEYEQPSISKGKSKIPLNVMSFPAALSKKEFSEVKRTLYSKVYKNI